MHLKSKCGAYAYVFTLTPGGWSLASFGYDPLFTPGEGFRYVDVLARHLKEEGRTHFKPVFSIDYIGTGLVNIAVETGCTTEEARAELCHHLTQLDDEFQLGLIPLIEGTLCSNFLNGLNGSLYLRSGLRHSESTQSSTSAPAAT